MYFGWRISDWGFWGKVAAFAAAAALWLAVGWLFGRAV